MVYALFVQLLIARLVVPLFAYWTSKNAIAGKSLYTVTETVLVSVPAFPTTVRRSPSPKASFACSCFCEVRRNPVELLAVGLSAMVTVSEAETGPSPFSVLSKRATPRVRGGCQIQCGDWRLE